MAKKKEVVMKCYGVIDTVGVLVGVVEQDEKEKAPELSISVPMGFDLIPFKYRWVEHLSRWEPIPKVPVVKFDMVAMVKGFMAIRDSGVVELPEETLKWLDEVKI